MQTRSPRIAVATMAAILLLVLGACGSDASDDVAETATNDDASQTTDTPVPDDATETTPTEAPAEEPTVEEPAEEPADEPGEPLKIMAFGTFESQNLSLDQARAGVQAHVQAINDAGGINGRMIEVVVCNDNFDPNEAASCARQAVDEGVVAVVGPSSGQAGAALPILEEANIPYLNGSGSGGTIELTSPVSFPLHGGSQAQLMAAGRALADEGAAKITIVVADADAAREAAQNIIRAIELGGSEANMVNAPLGAPDYSAVAAAALDNEPQGIVLATVPADAPKIVQSLRQAGYEGLIATSTGIVTQVGVDAIGDAAEGVLLLDRGQLPTDDSIPEIAEYLAGMAEYEDDAVIDAQSLNGWAAVTFFAELVRRTEGEITGQALIDTVYSLSEPIITGAFPPYSGPTDDPPAPEFPQVASFEANLVQVKDGAIVSYKGFVNPIAPS